MTKIYHNPRCTKSRETLKLLIEKAGIFDTAWFFGSLYFIPPRPMDESEDSDAMVIVLRRAKDRVKK